jgi:hypothetical protein
MFPGREGRKGGKEHDCYKNYDEAPRDGTSACLDILVELSHSDDELNFVIENLNG